MHFPEMGGRRYARFETLACLPGLVHAFSTRPHDVSARRDAQQAQRDERRRAMARDWGLNPDRLRYCVQVHEPRIAVVESAQGDGRMEGVDGLVTALPDTPLMTFSADCPLVLVFDARQAVVGMVHASWRCTVARACARLVETLRRRFGCRPDDLFAGVGPSAGPGAYEVQQDVYDAAGGAPWRERCFLRREGRLYFDLWSANRLELERAGVPPERIEVASLCTMTRTDVFYSFRREGAGCGHFGLMAGIGAAAAAAHGAEAMRATA